MDYVQCTIEIPLQDFDVSTAQGKTDLYIFIEQKIYSEGINQFTVGESHFNLAVGSPILEHLPRILDNA